MTIERLDIDNCTDRLQGVLHRQRYAFVLSHLKQQERVLEIGTGVGAFTRELLPMCGNYVGIEFDPEACNEARKRTGGKANIIQADARDLPFANEQFSFIICLEVLEHLGDWKSGVQHIHRCLEKEGTAIISVPYRRRGGRSTQNKYHLYEPGENELMALLCQLFKTVQTNYQFFEESPFMTIARTLHLRRFVGLSHLYADLSSGEARAVNRLFIDQRSRGLTIGIIAVVTGKK